MPGTDATAADAMTAHAMTAHATAVPATAAGQLPAREVEEQAERWGTPLFLLSSDRLRANLAAFTAALTPAQVLYSLKTNYLPAVTAVLRAGGTGVDVVSGYELAAALDAGFAADRIVFNGPVKTLPELRRAVAAGVYVNIDGAAEIAALAGICAGAAEPLPVGLRVYPPQDINADAAPPPGRALPSKFGWPIATGDADRLADAILGNPALRLTGVHCHLGSQITRPDALLAALDALMAWVVRLRGRAPVDRLNIGGGFGVPGIQRLRGAVAGLSEVRAGVPQPPPPVFALEEFGDGLRALLATHGLTDLDVYCEPGRALVSDAMSLVTRVVGVKRTGMGTWVLLDGGLNLLPTAGVAERHRVWALRDTAPPEPVLLGGPLCYEGDVFALDALLPADVCEGDLVVIEDAGAYSVTRATSFNRPRIPVVELDGGQARLCWRGEEYADIFQFAVPAQPSVQGSRAWQSTPPAAG